MRNAMILLGLWVGIILTAYAVVFVGDDAPTPGQSARLEYIAAGTVVDVEGRFQFEAPPGWRVSRTEDGVHLVDPVESMEAWIVVVEDMAAPRAIRIACEWSAPCEGRGSESFEELVPPSFAERKVKVVYETDDEDVLVYGTGFVRRVGGTIVLLVRADRATHAARSDELARIEDTLAVPAIGEPPLT